MWAKVLLLFFVFSFLFRTDHSFDQDLGRHIKLGEIIWNTKEVPRTNLFSYTNPDFPFINTHWLFGVIAYFFTQTIGIQVLLFLKVLIILLSVWLIIKTIPKQNTILILPVGFIFLHVLRERAELRPEVFSFLFTALTLFILNKFSQTSSGRGTFDKNKSLFLLPIIQLLWVNTHIYFFIGLLLQAIFIIHLIYQRIRTQATPGRLKALLIIFVLSAGVILINPNGLTGVLYPLNVTKNYGYTIVENQTMFLLESIGFRDANFLFVKVAIALTALSILFVILNAVKNLMIKSRDPSATPQDDRVKNILLSLSGVGLALMNVRSFPYLVFLSLPAVLQNFGLTGKNKMLTLISIIFGCILILESFIYLNGDYYKYRDEDKKPGLTLAENGKGAMDFMLSNNLPGPIYNNFDIGSYIIYRGYLPAGRQVPKYQVFVDGRPEAYPATFFQEIYMPSQSDLNKFKEQDKKWQFQTILFSHTDQTPWGRNFLQNIVKDSDWKVVYIDDFILVLVKNEIVQQKNLTAINLSTLSPDTYRFTNHVSYLRLGYFLLSTQNFSGVNFIQKSLQIFPNSLIGNGIMGNSVSNPFFW